MPHRQRPTFFVPPTDRVSSLDINAGAPIKTTNPRGPIIFQITKKGKMPPVMLSVNCPFKDTLVDVFKRDSVQFVLCTNTNYDIYDDEIDRYFLFFDSTFKDRLRRLPEGTKCSVFVRMSVGVGGEIHQRQWEGVAKLSADMFPHCVLPYITEDDIKRYFVVKLLEESIREKQLKLIERMSWYEELIDRNICERLLNAVGSVTNILRLDKQAMMDVLGPECESVVNGMQQFIQAKQDYYIQ